MMLVRKSASASCLAIPNRSSAVPAGITSHSTAAGRSRTFAVCRATQQDTLDLREAQAAFNASLQRIVSATCSAAVGPGGAEHSMEQSSSEIGRLALLHSTTRRFSRTHMNTVNMSLEEEEGQWTVSQQLPLSQLAFKSLLRASLAAARLNHSALTTPHMLLGLLSATPPEHSTTDTATTRSSSSSSSTLPGPVCLSAVAGRSAEVEAAVRIMIDGPKGSPVSSAAAAASVFGQSGGLDVVTWCGQLSSRAQAVLAAAEQLRQQQGHSLLTSRHLLLALLHQDASCAAATPWVSILLAQLGLQADQLAQQLQQELCSAAPSAAACSDDTVLCEPVGFLHEEFYSSLLRSMFPAAPASYSLN